MKILLISNLFPPDVLGGYEILCAQVGELLQRGGHEVSVLTGRRPIHETETDGASDPFEAPFPVMRRLALTASFGLPPRHNRLRRWAVARENERITRSVLDDLNPDVVFLWSQRRLSTGAARAVEFLGMLSSEALAEVYRAHDILVFPSEWNEAFGLTHLEAMASGLPVISTAEGGQGEFLRHEENALVFRQKDVGALADAIVRLAKDCGLAQALAQEGRRTVEKGFTLDRYGVALEDFLMETVTASRL